MSLTTEPAPPRTAPAKLALHHRRQACHQAGPRRADRRAADLDADPGVDGQVVDRGRVLRLRPRGGELRLLHEGPSAEVPAARAAVPARVPGLHDHPSPASPASPTTAPATSTTRPRRSTPWRSAENGRSRDRADYPVVPIDQDGTVSMLVTFPEAPPHRGRRSSGPTSPYPGRPPQTCSVTGDRVTGARRLHVPEPGHPCRPTPTTTPSGRRCGSPLNLETGTFLRPTGVSVAKEVRGRLRLRPEQPTP